MGKKKTDAKEGRELILKAGKMITNRIPIALGLQKLTTEDPEYWGLDALLTDEMAEVILAMERRKPRTLDEVVKLTGKDKARVEELLKEYELPTESDGSLTISRKIQPTRSIYKMLFCFFANIYFQISKTIISIIKCFIYCG